MKHIRKVNHSGTPDFTEVTETNTQGLAEAVRFTSELRSRNRLL